MSTKTQNGGQAVTTAPSKNATSAKAETTTATSQTPKAPEAPTAEKPILTVEAQLAKMEKLGLLFEKREKLTDTLENLTAFRVAKDEMGGNKLEISDGRGNSFKTYSPDFIRDVLALIEAKAEQLLLQTNGEIIALA